MRPHAPASRLTRAPRRPPRGSGVDGRPRRRARRIASLAIAVVELAALVALLVAPAFHISRVDVSGNRRLTAAQVVAAAGLQQPGSVFQVDAGQLERRLTSTTWVRAASVGAQLPDRVRIHVDEWQPAAVYRAAGGPAWYLSAEAVVLGPAGADAGTLLGIDGPAQPAPRTGRPPLERALLTALVNIQRSLPDIIGQEVRSFTIDSCGNLTMNAKAGWKAQFGRVITPEELATLKDKVAALKALAASGGVDFNSVQYVNLMNPYAVAVPTRSPAARPGRASPSPSPSPSAVPQVVSPCS
jgi:cell division septal protein FtsQ